MDKFYMLDEQEAVKNPDALVFVNVMERAANEKVGNMIPGNYWNRLNDNEKVKIANNFQYLAFIYGRTDGAEGVKEGYLQNIITSDATNRPYASDRLLGAVRIPGSTKTKLITYGMTINPGGAEQHVYSGGSPFPANGGGYGSRVTLSNQSFRPNLVGVGGRNYTNADGKYIPIHLRPPL